MKPLDELTTKCIRCGFCLEACPTFRLTGEETESPRGRIYLVRSADEGLLDWEATRPHIDACLGCRACETACPSGVEYGQIFEAARDRLESAKPRRARRLLLSVLTRPKALRWHLAVGRLIPGRRIPGFVSQLLSGCSPEADRPKPQVANLAELEEGGMPPVRGKVLLLEGCVMQMLYPRVHQATRTLLRRVGFLAHGTGEVCCGALHAHNGRLDEASANLSSLPKGATILTNSAGCGSWLKDSGIDAVDLSEFLVHEGLLELLATSPGLEIDATYHDACHLSHGQGIRNQPRQLIRAIPKLQYHELEEADFCCGSAGIYNVTQPEMARRLLERKWGHIADSRARVVAMGNPGCHAWIAQAAREHGGQIRVLHTAELLEASFRGSLDAFV